MPATGLFFLPTTTTDPFPLPTFLNALTAHYDPTPLPQWSLHHRLFRDQKPPPTSDVAPQTGPRYLQVLSLSHHRTASYVAITRTSSAATSVQTRAGTPASSTPSGSGVGNGSGSGNAAGETTTEPATIIAIPAGTHTEEFVQLLIAKFGPMWTQRQTLGVRNGLAFQVGAVVVRVGEVLQGGAAGGMGPGARGVVVEVAWGGGDEGEEGESGGESGREEKGEGEEEGDGLGLVQAFWDSLGVKGARECVGVPGMGEGFGVVRQWCEVLRIRS